MKLSLRNVTARAARLDLLVGSAEFTAPAIDGPLGPLEAHLHEIGHVVTLRGSLRCALRCPIRDVDGFMRRARLRGVIRDENEVSTIAVELLAAEMLGHPIDRLAVIRFAWKNRNVRHFANVARFHSRVLRRVKNTRCIELAREIARCLAKPIYKRKRAR